VNWSSDACCLDHRGGGYSNPLGGAIALGHNATVVELIG
jgi:hypothetical protein